MESNWRWNVALYGLSTTGATLCGVVPTGFGAILLANDGSDPAVFTEYYYFTGTWYAYYQSTGSTLGRSFPYGVPVLPD